VTAPPPGRRTPLRSRDAGDASPGAEERTPRTPPAPAGRGGDPPSGTGWRGSPGPGSGTGVRFGSRNHPRLRAGTISKDPSNGRGAPRRKKVPRGPCQRERGTGKIPRGREKRFRAVSDGDESAVIFGRGESTSRAMTRVEISKRSIAENATGTPTRTRVGSKRQKRAFDSRGRGREFQSGTRPPRIPGPGRLVFVCPRLSPLVFACPEAVRRTRGKLRGLRSRPKPARSIKGEHPVVSRRRRRS
jgi:hypothetical protein